MLVRGRALVLVVLLGFLVLSITACVPYPKFQEAHDKLAVANKINRDLETQLKNASVELTTALGGEGMSDAAAQSLRVQLEDYKLENLALQDEVDLLRVQIREVEPIVNQFQPEDVPQDSDLRVYNGGIVISSDLLFTPGRALLRKKAKRSLDDLANLLTTKYVDRAIELCGHTDNTPINASKKFNKDNWELASRRAHSVFEYLKGKGVPAMQMVLVSYGYAAPFGSLDPDSKAGRDASRRVEIRLGS